MKNSLTQSVLKQELIESFRLELLCVCFALSAEANSVKFYLGIYLFIFFKIYVQGVRHEVRDLQNVNCRCYRLCVTA